MNTLSTIYEQERRETSLRIHVYVERYEMIQATYSSTNTNGRGAGGGSDKIEICACDVITIDL